MLFSMRYYEASHKNRSSEPVSSPGKYDEASLIPDISRRNILRCWGSVRGCFWKIFSVSASSHLGEQLHFIYSEARNAIEGANPQLVVFLLSTSSLRHEDLLQNVNQSKGSASFYHVLPLPHRCSKHNTHFTSNWSWYEDSTRNDLAASAVSLVGKHWWSTEHWKGHKSRLLGPIHLLQWRRCHRPISW